MRDNFLTGVEHVTTSNGANKAVFIEQNLDDKCLRSARSRYVDVRYHFLRELAANGRR